MWSKKFNKCIKCGTTTIKHKGYGYCQYCYNRLPEVMERRAKLENKYYHIRSRNLKKRKEFAEKTLKYYHEKIKPCKEKIEKRRERQKRYDKTKKGKETQKRSNRKANEKLRFYNFLKKTSHIEKKGITIVCYGCSKQCQVVSPIQDIRNEQERMKRFRQVLIKYCDKKI